MFKSKKNQEVVEEFLNPDATNYLEYHFTKKERIQWFVLAFIVVFAVGYIFYANIIVSSIVGLIGGYFFIPLRRNQIIVKRKMNLQLQFRDLLESLATSLGAGRNITDSFFAAREDLVVQHSEKSDIVDEVDGIIQGYENGISIENLLLDFAKRCKLVDIVDFADVFDTCNSRGGNIKEVISKTEKVIHEKMEIKMDIETMITEKKTEQNGMMVMPIVFVFIMRTMGGDMVDLNSGIGMIASTVALVFFIAAYFVGKKILSIKI